jgi:hypothetical protein
LIPKEQTAVYTVSDFVRRVVDSLLHGERRGAFLCARCLLKLTREHLDRSYSKTAIAEAIDEIFSAPSGLTHVASSVCGGCGRKKTACIGASPGSVGGSGERA